MRKPRKKTEGRLTHWYCGNIKPDGEVCRRMLHTHDADIRKKCECGGFMVTQTDKQLEQHRKERRQHLLSCH